MNAQHVRTPVARGRPPTWPPRERCALGPGAERGSALSRRFCLYAEDLNLVIVPRARRTHRSVSAHANAKRDARKAARRVGEGLAQVSRLVSRVLFQGCTRNQEYQHNTLHMYNCTLYSHI